MDNQTADIKLSPDISSQAIEFQKKEKPAPEKKEEIQTREKDQFIPSENLKIKKLDVSPSESLNKKRETIKNQVAFYFNIIKK